MATRPAGADRGRRHRRAGPGAGSRARIGRSVGCAGAARGLRDGGRRHPARAQRRARPAAPRRRRCAARAGRRARVHAVREGQAARCSPGCRSGRGWRRGMARRTGSPIAATCSGAAGGGDGHRRVELRTGFEVASAAHTDTGVLVTCAAGETLAGAALIGADGLWSTVRRRSRPARRRDFVGATATRTVIPAPDGGPLAQPVGRAVADARRARRALPRTRGRDVAVVVIAAEHWQGTDWNALADAAVCAPGSPASTPGSPTCSERCATGASGRSTAFPRCRPGEPAASLCSAMPPTRCCPTWRRAG